jgi:hypothetical protein
MGQRTATIVAMIYRLVNGPIVEKITKPVPAGHNEWPSGVAFLPHLMALHTKSH